MNPSPPRSSAGPVRISTNRRLSIWYAVIIFIIAVITLRLFYLQIIRHDYYQKAALSDQLKQYTIAPERGIIEAHQGNGLIPLVLNQKLYTLYADPTLVKDPAASAAKLSSITHDSASDYQTAMEAKNSRYAVLAKRLSEDQKNQILSLKLPGIGAQAQDYRVYPQGNLAAQVLGFVNDAGQGNYGIEQEFNNQLAGQPGLLKAITDVNGVPLAASRDNVQINPKPGDNFVLTIDTGMQQQLEAILAQGLQKVGSKSGAVLIMDPNDGSIKAMASYPTFDPSQFYNVKDLSAFNNLVISNPLEVGSIMKTLTISAGINQGVITPDTTYQDPGSVTVDGSTIVNVHAIPENPTSIKDVLQYSLNTGAVHVLKELGGGDFSQKGRDIWYDYLTNHYQMGKLTGIEEPNEQPGVVPKPDSGYALDLQYANMAFGQGMTATMLQMGSALSSILNGGTYYQPHLIDSQINPDGTVKKTMPKVVKQNVVKPSTGQALQGLMEYVFQQNHVTYESDAHPGYNVGGKTGTGQIPAPGGGYKDGVYNGTFVGFVGGDKPQYVVTVLVDSPDLPGFESAGAQAAAPIFGHVADMLINDFGATPATH